jgi:hypothetical protein
MEREGEMGLAIAQVAAEGDRRAIQSSDYRAPCRAACASAATCR